MPTKPGRRSLTASGSRDQREIVAAIHGGPLPASAIKRSVALLEGRIVKRFELHKAHFAKAAAQQKRVLAPLMKFIKDDRRAAEAARAYAKVAPPKRRARPPLPLGLPRVAPQVRGGSVLTIAAPPYSVDWGSGAAAPATAPPAAEASAGRATAASVLRQSYSPEGAHGVAAAWRPRFSQLLKTN